MAAEVQQAEFAIGLIETSRGVQACSYRLKGSRAEVSFIGGRTYTYPANIILPLPSAHALTDGDASSRYVAGMYTWAEDGDAITCTHPLDSRRSYRLRWNGVRWECSCEYFKRYCGHRADDMCKHGVASNLILRGEAESEAPVVAAIPAAHPERRPYVEIMACDW